MTERYNNQDLLAKDKLEVSSFLLYKKEYRDISNDAKLLYQYLVKRFSVTIMKKAIAMEEDTMENFSFIDEAGDLFCFCSNDELRFVLGMVTEKTVIKCKKELKRVGLLEEVRQTSPKNNRLYVTKIKMDAKVKSDFKQDLLKFKTEEAAKRKVRNAKRKGKNEEESEPQNLQFTTDSSEQQNLQFSEQQNLQFMNCKIYSHSTKEEVSTYEFISTDEQSESKSVSLSIDEVLNELVEIPMNVRKQIQLNQKRLTDDKIDLFEIIAFYQSTENTIHDNDFAMILSNVLKKTKGTIHNFHSVMRTAISNWRKEYEGLSPAVTFENIDGELPEDFFKLPDGWEGNR